jgi:hypothetical protein
MPPRQASASARASPQSRTADRSRGELAAHEPQVKPRAVCQRSGLFVAKLVVPSDGAEMTKALVVAEWVTLSSSHMRARRPLL